jgi:hypothetical protein
MTAELIRQTTIHNTCLIRSGIDPLAGWCMDHAAPVYRDGIDWHTDQDREGVVFVLDAHRANNYTSDRVTVACPDGTPDAALAEAAGYDTRHTGYHVTRYVDGTALVLLHND